MAKPDARKGRRQHAASPTGQVHRPKLTQLYRHELTDITPGEFEFTFDIRRGGHWLGLDTFVTSASWADESAVLSGQLTLRRPDLHVPSSLPVGVGYSVRCRTRQPGGLRWHELWRMRAGIPAATVETGEVIVDLKDDLDPLRRNRRDWHFRQTKRRKRGYFPHEIVRLVARREGIRLGRIARGTKRIPKIVEKDTSALDIIRAAYVHERSKTGARFVIRMTAGRLEILPYQRNPILYVFGNQIQTATVQQDGNDRPVTVLEGVGRIGKGHKATHVRHTEMDRSLVQRFGYLHRKKDYGVVSSKADLRQQVRRDYATGVRFKPSATFSYAGVPYVRRGEGIFLRLPQEGFKGRDEQSLNRAFVYVTAVRHQLDGSSVYTTEYDVSVDDPFYSDRKSREKIIRHQKHAKRTKRKKK